MEVLTTLKNAFQSFKKKIINPIGDYLHDYCSNRIIIYLDTEERTRHELVEIIGLPIDERYIIYISHPIATYKICGIYFEYYTIVIWCSTTVIACAKYFIKAHRD